jgi:hypothetical protein
MSRNNSAKYEEFLRIFFLGLILIGGCRQKEASVSVPPPQNDAVKSIAIRVSAAETDAAEPAIAADADGKFYVVYVAHGTEKSADIYLQKFDSQQKQIGERVRVNRVLGEATAWRGDPPTIAVGANKTVYVGWTKIVKTDAKSGTDLCLSVSRDGGKSFDAAVKVNDDIAPVSHGMHSLAVGKDGAVYLAWLDERNVKSELHAQTFQRNTVVSEFQFVKVHQNSNQPTETKKVEKKHEAAEPNSEIFFSVSNDGGKTFSANVKLSSEVCPCCKTSLIIAPDGRIYASWRQVLTGDFRHIAVASSNDAGVTFSAPTIVSDDQWKINACPVSGAALAVGANSALNVAWFSAGIIGAPGLYFSQSFDGGKTFSPRELISENAAAGTPVLKGGATVWSADGKVFAKKQNADAEIITDGELPTAAVSGDKILVAFVEKEKEKRGVWLSVF